MRHRRITVDMVSLVAVVVLCLAALVIARALQHQADAWRWVVHTRDVLQRLERVNALTRGAESAERGYVLTSDDAFRTESETAAAQLETAIAAVAEITRDNPAQQASARELGALADERLRGLAHVTASNTGGTLDRAAVASGRPATDAIASRVAAMQAEEQRLLSDRERQVADGRRDLYVWIGASTVVALLLIVFMRWVSRRDALAIRSGLAKVNAIYRAAPVGLAYVDRDMRLVELNDALAGINGLPRAEQIGRRPEEMLSPELAERVTAFYRRVLSSGQARVGVEVSGATLGRGAEARDWLASYQPVVEDAQVTGIVVAILDVTALKQAQRELAEANRTLERRVAERTEQLTAANEELQAFAHTVAHDLRAPLRNIEGFATVLREDESADASSESRLYLRRIQVGVRRMDQLISDLLAYSRLGRSELQRETVDLGAAVQGVLRDLDSLIRETQASVHVQGPLPGVCGNRQLVVQVLSNLIGNALKFTADGVRPAIVVSAERHADSVDLVIEDNGIGIAPEHRDRVFGVFERLHGQEAYPGTGIGLAIVKRAVTKMQGDVAVTSAPAGGARFVVSLPAVDVERCHA